MPEEKGGQKMKFREMPYERPDKEALIREMKELTEAFRNAPDYGTAKEVFLKEQEFEKHLMTLETLVGIRHSIDTNDAFYDGEETFWNNAGPELQEYSQQWTMAMLASPFRAEFEKDYGKIMFLNAEIDLKAFSPEIIGEMQKEADLVTEYMKLIASAKVPFEGGIYTISQLEPFRSDPDDGRRLAAWKADGAWYKSVQPDLDRIYDELVKLRDTMGRKMGYGGFTKLGYYRMQRNCYDVSDVAKFREGVRKYLVPIADRIYREQAKRTGLPYPLSYADQKLSFRSGNPKPQGSADDILSAADRFYHGLSPETDEFWKTMREGELLDVLSTKGKEAGGYCTGIPDYGVPFIFANFNGTQGDVEVVTHEAGHAFACYVNRDRIPLETVWPGLEACEVHSMSMEFFAWRAVEDFFGKDAAKYRYSHLASALKFIPYGTLVDHFQHEVYARPEMTPAERHAVWKELQGEYMPWLRLDGEIPFYADGEAWQRQQHIYNSPFYYIDYCLAQTVSLMFWAMIQEDPEDAWAHYMAYTKQGGGAVFTELLSNAGLRSPFGEETLRAVCEKAAAWLDQYDLTGIG